MGEMIIPGALLVGLGVGIILGEWLAGGLIGLGSGFLIYAIVNRNRRYPWSLWTD